MNTFNAVFAQGQFNSRLDWRSDVNDKVTKYLGKLEDEKFWGQLTLKLECGRVVFVRVEQGFKTADLTLTDNQWKGGNAQCR